MGRPRTWTDDDLREAVARCTTMAGVVQRLRLARGGASYVTVRSRMEQLGLALPAPASVDVEKPQQRGWSDEELREAVAAATSLHAVFTHLGLSVGGSQWLVVRSLILERGWSTAHWSRPLEGGADATPSEAFREALACADLIDVVRDAHSRADIIRSLGFTPSRTTYRILAEAMRTAEVSEDGLEAPHEAMRRTARPRYRTPLEEILVANSTYASISTLKRRLVDEGVLQPACSWCGIDRQLARCAHLAPPRSRQRNQERSPAREPPSPVSQLPLADRDVRGTKQGALPGWTP